MSPDHTAAESALGYLYQAELALLELVTRSKSEPAIRISLEVFDDVAFDEEGRPNELLQTKHHLRSQGSLSNASVDLWGTLAVWLDALTAGTADAQLTAFTLVTTTPAPDGSAAAALRSRESRDIRRAQGVLEQTARTSSNRENATTYQKFLSLHTDLRTELLNRVVVFDAAPTIADIPALLAQELRFATSARYRRPLADRLLGWWHGRVVRHFLTEEDRILAEEVDNEVVYLADFFRSDNLPIDVTIEDITVDDLEEDDRVFVRQLQLIAVTRPTLELAIRDYKRAYLQRSRWLDDQLIWPSELRDYERKLIDEWQHQFSYTQGMEASDEAEFARAGLELYRILQDKDLWVRPRCQERFVPRGSFHMLSDEMKVGWHPDFVERLRAIVSEAG